MIQIILGFLLFSSVVFSSEPHHEVIPNAFIAGEKVELFWQRPEDEGKYPVLIIVHGYQGKLRKGASLIANSDALNFLASRKMIAVAFSQSGYGLTTGEPDHAGKKSQAALRTVIRYVKTIPGADKNRIVLYGTSMGATLTAITATQEPQLKALILENGMYDVQAAMTNLWFRSLNDPGPLRELYQYLDEETGSGQAERSAALHAEKIKAQVMILAGLGDDVALPDQALRFHELILNAGGRSEFHLFPFAGHAIPEFMKRPMLTRLIERVKRD